MLHLLIALNLLLLAMGGGTALLAWWSGLIMEQKWRTEALVSEGDLSRCLRQLKSVEGRTR